MATNGSGNALLDDDFIDPEAFTVRHQKVRDGGVSFLGSLEREKPAAIKRSPQFYVLKNALLKIRPEFSCDWDSTSEAQLQTLLAIELDKAKNHYSRDSRQKDPVQGVSNDKLDQVLSGIKRIAEEVGSLKERISKLEKSDAR